MSHPSTDEPFGAGEALREWFNRTRGVDVDVELAGVVFGGRSGEAPQCPHSYTFDNGTLEMHFNTTETLTVIRPHAVELGYSGKKGTRDLLIIPDAEEVRWGWHYYGRSATPDNWCTETYRFEGDIVARTLTGPIRAYAPATLARRGAAAVRLVPLFDRETMLHSAREAASSPDPDIRRRAFERLHLLGVA